MADPSETHNQLAHDFVMKVAASTKTHAELMVVVESALLAVMLISHRAYGFAPAGAVEMVDMAVQQATDRFAAQTSSRSKKD